MDIDRSIHRPLKGILASTPLIPIGDDLLTNSLALLLGARKTPYAHHRMVLVLGV
jgi:hypothetical protein